MKSLVFLSLIFSVAAGAESIDIDEIEFPLGDKVIIVGDQTYTVDVALNPQTVLCLTGDYGANSFKIAVPQIDDLTFLDHTSPGAPGPCINAGLCKTKDKPWGSTTDDRFSIFHDLHKPEETAKIRVVRKEVLHLSGGRCVRNYMEHVSSTIRGVVFQHVASLPLAETSIENCK